MLPTSRPVIWVVVLAVGYPLGIGACSAQAQVLSSAQALGSVSPAPAPADPTTYRTSQPGRVLNATPQLTIRRSTPRRPSTIQTSPPHSPLSGTSPIDQQARCSRSMIAMASPRSSAGERFARGMTP